MSGESISEAARERETFRHDPSLFSDIRSTCLLEPTATLELSTRADPILTALAQLGVCRTKASRAFISLFDRAHQYVIAESTKSSSLRTDPSTLGGQEPLWLWGTAIPRSNGICSKFLNTVKSDENDKEIAELPVSIIRDIRQHPEVSQETCILWDSPVRGYVAVPIRSRNGIDFGEFSVVTEQPIQDCDWGEEQFRLLREISLSILDHLLSKASQTERRRAEKKTQGIGTFVEQRLASMNSQQGSSYDKDHENPFTRDMINPKSIGAPNNNGNGSSKYTPSPPKLGPIPEGPRRSPRSTGRNSPSKEEEDPLTTVFTRASNTIRESIEADGVIFLDASAGLFSPFGSQYTGSDASQFNTSDEESWDSDNTASSSMNQDTHIIASSPLQYPRVDKETHQSTNKRLPFKALSALLRRYPSGAVMDFDENGQLQPSSGDSKPQCPTVATGSAPKLTKRRTSSFIGNLGNEVSKAFPGAQSVAFVPVWDQVRKRWRAGCFAYTFDRTRFFRAQDLSYLFAVSTLAIAEISSLETNLAHQAQSDVLGSLSHELRSPLHGIILGVEFLSDTSLSVFQGNLLHILETCGRTLSDTIDHLLYYAKVNNFIPPGKTHDSRARGLRKEMNYSLQAGMRSITTPVRLDVLVEDVTESIFAGFNFQRLSIGQFERGRQKSQADVYAMRRDDSFQATEDLKDWIEDGGDVANLATKFRKIDLAIDVNCSHYYHAISGAIRRIVMNLFGNALKFTSSGSIRVELSQEIVPTKKARNTSVRWVKIAVTDTGKGICEDFLANSLFKEFHQENNISPGLGLGLCVVKKIVSSLRGKVSIASKVGVGTTATVLLPLQPIAEPESDEYTKQKRQLKGLRVCFVGFDAPLGLPGQKDQPSDYQSIWDICRKHLAMEIVLPSQAVYIAPDIVLCEETSLYDSFVERDALSKTPLVVVCGNALAAYRLSVDPRFRDSSTITEFISQPTGPRKLAKILLAALQRWVERQDQPEPPDSNMASLSLRRVSTRSHEECNMPMYHKETFNILNLTGPGPFEAPAADRSARPPRSPSLSPRSSLKPEPEPYAESAALERYEPQKFLLVEDNAINMRILCAYMKKLGRSYVTAQDGQYAVEKYVAKPGHFNCLLMDINMPRLDGLQATRQIREFEAANHLPPSTVIALSGLASATVQQEALESGVDLFLTKPVKLQDISQILKSMGLM
ncbi:hypothetical protein F5B22DRAFT_523468 [Xylaria bambusicola]|uniref:uncharacterized protein n=1 Tax=Xylaria bambusicola TaxID=326684 RepID=UPI002007C8EF|nr:uncharacterized protein F5B22DRAFT_523468 [Xylaria bambusicola]KAI0505525.1 hypothetical protein F5B22DRAFT_523468 [Xylaria bambusicola]